MLVNSANGVRLTLLPASRGVRLGCPSPCGRDSLEQVSTSAHAVQGRQSRGSPTLGFLLGVGRGESLAGGSRQFPRFLGRNRGVVCGPRGGTFQLLAPSSEMLSPTPPPCLSALLSMGEEV